MTWRRAAAAAGLLAFGYVACVAGTFVLVVRCCAVGEGLDAHPSTV